MKYTRIWLLMFAMGCFIATGCQPDSTASNSDTAAQDDHDHDHDGHDHSHDGHDHSHDGHDHGDEGKLGPIGPNGGHTLTFKGGDLKGEWLHYNDNDVIRLVLLETNGMDQKMVKADSVTIKRTKGKDDDPVFELEAENANDNGESSSYMLDDKDLAIAMTLGVTIEIKAGDAVYTGTIPKHEPHSH